MNFSSRIIVCSWLVLASMTVHANEFAQLVQHGQDSIANGHYRDAQQQFSAANVQATTQHNGENLLLVQVLQGYLALQQHLPEAEQLLNTALVQATQHTNQDLLARIHLYLGQLYAHNQDNARAEQQLQQAVSQPEQVQDKSLLVSGFYQLASVAIENNNAPVAWQQLQHAVALMNTLPSDANQCQLWLNIGYQTLQLYLLAPQDRFLAAAFSQLNTALAQARHYQQLRTQASALKHLATLYQQQQRANEAINLLLESIRLAEIVDASDLLIDLAGQLGKLYQQQQHADKAITAYRLAITHIEQIRLDIPVSYRKGHSSFRDTFAPLYLSLADLLLQQSSTASQAQQQVLLAEARDSIERMKKSELEDYFQSRCEVFATPINLQKTDSHAAAIYPIILPDRLELIVYTAEGLHRFTSPVTAKELGQQARLFSGQLRDYADFAQSKLPAQRLYRWLIAPLNRFLQQQHIETLVYIPDGVLRLVPLAALYDGKQFVIEHYAVVVSPGMSLIDSSDVAHQKRMLLAGMSVPGEVVRDLPNALLSDLVVESTQKNATNRSVMHRKRELLANEPHEKTRELRDLLRNPVVIENLQQLLSLPSVDVEIKQLAELNNTSYLLNESFTLENFTQRLKQEPHDILHIASHGFFGSTAEDSFIMTYDKVLNLKQLEMLLSSNYLKRFPIDLLTLSACQTAEGDDRSPLGISGVAIKTKVHSTLGSLWSVSDETTAELMTHFYTSLNQPKQTKAKALQVAMLGLLKQEKFANPSFWSPFILIGEWL